MAHFVRRVVEQGYRVAMVARFESCDEVPGG
jgi:hypothetical protein